MGKNLLRAGYGLLWLLGVLIALPVALGASGSGPTIFTPFLCIGSPCTPGGAGTITATGTAYLGTVSIYGATNNILNSNGLTLANSSTTFINLGGNLKLTGPSSNNLQCGRGSPQSSPNSCTIQIGESGSGPNIAAGNGEIDLPVGTGTGALPTFTFKAPTALQGSGSTAQTLSTVFKEALGDIEIGAGSAIATNSTSGFFALETMNGAPTGTPANAAAGLSQCVINYASENLNCYVNGAWYHVAMTSGAN